MALRLSVLLGLMAAATGLLIDVPSQSSRVRPDFNGVAVPYVGSLTDHQPHFERFNHTPPLPAQCLGEDLSEDALVKFTFYVPHLKKPEGGATEAVRVSNIVLPTLLDLFSILKRPDKSCTYFAHGAGGPEEFWRECRNYFTGS